MQKTPGASNKMKPASITFKTTHKIKEVLEQMAKNEFRSLSMQVEKIVVEHLEKHGIDWREEKDE